MSVIENHYSLSLRSKAGFFLRGSESYHLPEQAMRSPAHPYQILQEI